MVFIVATLVETVATMREDVVHRHASLSLLLTFDDGKVCFVVRGSLSALMVDDVKAVETQLEWQVSHAHARLGCGFVVFVGGLTHSQVYNALLRCEMGE